MTQLNTLGKLATTIASANGKTVITYHQTQIVIFDDNFITLNNGGYCTYSTAVRMNQASNQFNHGYHVYRKNGVMYVNHYGIDYAFNGEKILLNRSHTVKVNQYKR